MLIMLFHDLNPFALAFTLAFAPSPFRHFKTALDVLSNNRFFILYCKYDAVDYIYERTIVFSRSLICRGLQVEHHSDVRIKLYLPPVWVSLISILGYAWSRLSTSLPSRRMAFTYCFVPFVNIQSPSMAEKVFCFCEDWILVMVMMVMVRAVLIIDGATLERMLFWDMEIINESCAAINRSLIRTIRPENRTWDNL